MTSGGVVLLSDGCFEEEVAFKYSSRQFDFNTPGEEIW
jgi:hypothetical protein